MQSLLSQLKSSPTTNINKLPAILQQLLNQNQNQQSKLRVSKQLIHVLNKLLSKIHSKKQNTTYQYVTKIVNQLIDVLVHCLQNCQNAGFWFQTISLAAKNFTNIQVKISQSLIQLIYKGQNVDFQSLKCGQLFNRILINIKTQQLNREPQKFLNFLLKLPHLSSFSQASESSDKSPTQLLPIQTKQLYQSHLTHCLSHLQTLPLQIQSSIYNKLGDKVFSKLASPLALSQFLLSKINNQQQHPVILIQVLAALFILVGKYGLQLEKFYSNLENIIGKKRQTGKSLFRAKNSKRFLKLVQAAMRSSKVPFSNIVTLCRLLLQAIPKQRSQLTFWVLSFLVNLVKKHRQLQNHLKEFPEIEVFKYHYSPKVRSLIKQLSKNLNKSEYLDIEEFAVVNCKKLCNQKMEQIIQKLNNCEQNLQFKVPKIIEYL